MHARLDRGAVRLLTRTGLDWTHKYPAIAAAVASLGARQAYLDGELCGVPSRPSMTFAPENPVRTGLPAGGGSLERTRLCSRFPANREKYRELPRFPPEQALERFGRASVFNGLPKQFKQFPKTVNREGPARYQGIERRLGP
jgi:hypothetical protein